MNSQAEVERSSIEPESKNERKNKHVKFFSTKLSQSRKKDEQNKRELKRVKKYEDVLKHYKDKQDKQFKRTKEQNAVVKNVSRAKSKSSRLTALMTQSEESRGSQNIESDNESACCSEKCCHEDKELKPNINETNKRSSSINSNDLLCIY